MLLRWILVLSPEPAPSFATMFKVKRTRRNKNSSFKSIFKIEEESTSKDMRTEKFYQVVRIARVIHTLRDANGRMNQMFGNIFIENSCFIVSFISGSLIQLFAMPEDAKEAYSAASACKSCSERINMCKTFLFFQFFCMLDRFCNLTSWSIAFF